MGNSNGKRRSRSKSKEKSNTKSINKKLDRQSQRDETIQKILLLGAGSSGKSTFLKQLKYLYRYNRGFPKDEQTEYEVYVFRNLVEIVKECIKKCKSFDMTHEDQFIEDIKYFEEIDLRKFPVIFDKDKTNLKKKLRNSWFEKSINEIIEQGNKYILMDNALYFNDQIHRILGDNYLPSYEDIFNTRMRTTGLEKECFEYDNDVKYEIYDVGGQRSERRKWVKLFNNVSCVIFTISLNGYDQVLFEDSKRNRLEEGIDLLLGTCKLPIFKNINFNVFLNKYDLFSKKIKITTFEIYKDEYKGDRNNSENIIKFLSHKLRTESKGKINTIRITTATDSDSVHKTFAQVHYLIIQNDLNKVGFL